MVSVRHALIEMALRRQRSGSGSSLSFLRKRTADVEWPDVTAALGALPWATGTFADRRGDTRCPITLGRAGRPRSGPALPATVSKGPSPSPALISRGVVFERYTAHMADVRLFTPGSHLAEAIAVG
jgi:hypothetical protein